MDKNGTLTISDFHQGVADSPLLGFAKMNNVELFEKKGVAKMQYGTSLSFNTASLPTCMVYDSLGNQYVGCLGGQLYKNGSLLNTSGGICDMAIVTDGVIDPNGIYPIEYLLITRRDTSFTFYGPTYSGGATFSGGRSDLANGHYKKIVVGIDVSSNNTPYVYITNGNVISAIKTFTNATVGNPPTYTWVASALTLQPSYYAMTMAEIGKYLAIGTHGDPSGFAGLLNTGTINNKKASLVLWDRTSPTFNLPIYFKENAVTQLLQIQNKLYIGLGNRGRVLITDTTNVEQIKRLPFCFNRQFGTLSVNYPNALTLHNGEIVSGISTQGGSGDINGNYGVYTINLTPSIIGNTQIPYPTNLRNTISTGYTGDSNSKPMQIGLLHSTGQDVMYVGWQDGVTFGVDVVAYPTATAIIESKYFNIGNRLNQHSFKRMELSLSSPLITGQKIIVSYRTDVKDTYTELGTYTSTDFGTENSINKMANLAKIIDLQVKIEMSQPITTAIGNNIELISLAFTSSEK